MSKETEAKNKVNKEEPSVDVAVEDKTELEKLTEERDKYLGLARRTQADFDNYQKRAQREAEAERKYAQRALALEVIPAIDNLERFLANVKEETDLTKAVAMVHKQLLEGLGRQGVRKMASVDQPFDPNLHQAILEQPSEKPAGTILIEAESGFAYHDRVLRPAKVIVAKAM